MKIRPLKAELFHPKRKTDGRTDRQNDRHEETYETFLP